MRLPSTLLLSILAACGGGGEAPYEGPYRHVVLVSLDTTRTDHLSCYEEGHAATPRLDALAAAGTRFEDVTAAAPTTLASHTSLMTGTWPHTHGVARNGFTVHGDNRMLAELLSEAGFHTAGFLGSFALESRFDFDQGFDAFDEDFSVLVDEENYDQNQRLAEEVTAAALAHVEEVRDEVDRLFLFLQYFDPHAPYGPPVSEGVPRTTMREVDAAVRAHQKAITGEGYGHAQVILRGLPRELVGAADGLALPEDQRLVEAYAGEVAYMDRCLGDLFDGLEAAGILDEAVVVVTADHGETMYEHHDFWNHGLWLHQTTVSVPLILTLPDGRGAGRTVSTPVSNVDVLPTLCDLLEIEVPARAEGVSLLPLVDGQELARGPVFSEATQPMPTSGVERRGEWRNLYKPRAIRRGPWKLVVSPYNRVQQLFHLGDDPEERNDLLSERGGDPAVKRVAAELARELLAWQEEADPLPSSFESSESEDTARRLQGMGYAGAGEDEDG